MNELTPTQDVFPEELVSTELAEPVVALLEVAQVGSFSLTDPDHEPAAAVEEFVSDPVGVI